MPQTESYTAFPDPGQFDQGQCGRPPLAQLLENWQQSPIDGNFVDRRTLPAQPACSAPLPEWLDTRLTGALERAGISTLYSHQLESLEAIRRGENLVVATPTASGKSLCYTLPTLNALLEDPNARALFLFPTKALARDQIEGLRALTAHIAPGGDTRLGLSVYDGDTPPDQRRAARRYARILATNPDMLHAGMLPHHPGWAEFFTSLRYVVLDELHTYRGVFGSQVANVLRRLQRIARFHGANPQFIATSATIANPEELAETLFGQPARLIKKSGAPTGPKHFLSYNPPMIDPSIGLRQSYLKATCTLTRKLVQANLSTLVFCRSRSAVEVLVRYLRDTLAAEERDEKSVTNWDERVRGYRGGYLPDRRRGIERALRAGGTDVVVATSALELGIDVGGLDAVVIAGWPGSRAAAWQRSGRAGRRNQASLTVLVASSEPIDQFVAGEPEYLFAQEPEHARLDPDNADILLPHLKCAAFELPFSPAERFGNIDGDDTAEVMRLLAESGVLHHSHDAYHYVGDQFPAGEVSLRGELNENFVVVDQQPGKIIAEVDYKDAPLYLHDNAIYQLEGRQYEVHYLDHDAHKAYVSPVDVDYYTEAKTQVRVRVLEQTGSAAQVANVGEVQVLERVVGFKKIRLHTHENLGYGEVDQPDRDIHTTAFWTDFPGDAIRGLRVTPAALAEAVLCWSYALHTAASMVLMSDRRDLGRAVGDANSGWFTAARRSQRGRYSTAADGSPTMTAPRIFLYDAIAGGTGLAERLHDEHHLLYRRVVTMLENCACQSGCPACVGPGSRHHAKQTALALARIASQQLDREEDHGVHVRAS